MPHTNHLPPRTAPPLQVWWENTKCVLAQSLIIEGGLSRDGLSTLLYIIPWWGAPLPPYLLQYNLVITLTTLLQLPSVEFFKSQLISQLTVCAWLGCLTATTCPLLHPVLTKLLKILKLLHSLVFSFSLKLKFYSEETAVLHTDDWNWTPSLVLWSRLVEGRHKD